MCTGAILLFQIPRVVVGGATTFAERQLDFLASHGVDVVLLRDDERCCRAVMQEFQERYPQSLERGHRRAVVHCRKLTAVVFAR